MKRFRKCFETGSVRYFAVTEKGELFGRMHHHILIHFNNKVTIKRVLDIIKETWTFGRVDASRIRSPEKTANYVGKYLNKISSVEVFPRTMVSRGYGASYITEDLKNIT